MKTGRSEETTAREGANGEAASLTSLDLLEAWIDITACDSDKYLHYMYLITQLLVISLYLTTVSRTQ